MREVYFEHHGLTGAEFNELWQTCRFAFDASVLLNVYRFPDDTRQAFFSALRQIGSRLWLPRQVVHEFYLGRAGAIAERNRAPKEVEDWLCGIEKATQRNFTTPFLIDVPTLRTPITDAIMAVRSSAAERLSAVRLSPREDSLLDQLAEIVGDKFGDPYAPAELEEKRALAKERKEQRIPPGYKDDNAGDAIIWFQLIDKAKATGSPFIFVTDDLKEDWFQRAEGKAVIGPRPELLAEMRREAGVQCYIYTSDRFLRHASDHLQVTVGEGAINDARLARERSTSAGGTPRRAPTVRIEREVTAGHIVVHDRYHVSFSLSGSGFHFTGSVIEEGALGRLGPYDVGQLLVFDGRVAAGHVAVGSAAVDTIDFGEVVFAGNLHVSVPALQIPTDPRAEKGYGEFTFRAHLRSYHGEFNPMDEPDIEQASFIADLTGSGLAVVEVTPGGLNDEGQPYFEEKGLWFKFGTTESPA